MTQLYSKKTKLNFSGKNISSGRVSRAKSLKGQLLFFSLFLTFLPSLLMGEISRSNNKKSIPYQASYQRMASGSFSNSTFEIRYGFLWAYGNNAFGQLGLGNTTNQSNPVQVGSSSKWVSVTTGLGHTLGIQSDGTLRAWGYNGFGQLGFGNTAPQSTPLQVGTDNKWVSIAAGGIHTIGLKSDGTLWAWGYNFNGQLGLGNNVTSNSPLQIGTANNWVNIAAGANQSLAIKSDGTLWAWGNNDDGQLGLGNTAGQNVPVQVGTDNKWVNVVSSSSHTIGIKSDGTLWAWGYNLFGQLGLGDNTDRTSPVQVGTDNKWVSISVGDNHTLAIKANGTLWSWGWNYVGSLGLSDNTDRNIPTQVGTGNKWVSIAGGEKHSLGLQSDGTLHTWGYNSNGQLGLGNLTDQNVPALAVASPIFWLTFSLGANHTLGIKANGTLWSWGKNDLGQLGLGDYLNRKAAVQIGTDNNWVSVSAGYAFSLGIKSDGTLWGWGYNGSGELGLGDNFSRNLPNQVGTDNDWVSLATGGDFTLGLKSNGTLWTWGTNVAGQLGLGNNASINAPLQVGTDNKWVSIAVGNDHAIALKSNGTLWTWGANAVGQLGLGNNTNQNAPVQVGTENKWISVAGGSSHSLAIKSTGTLWAWGNNLLGQLALGDNINRKAPVQVGTDTKWINMAGGSNHSFSLLSDGTIWSSGWNLDGQLGLGDNIDRFNLFQNFLQNNIVALKCGFAHTGILKSIRDNVCMTGDNAFGQLGHNTIIDENIFGCSQIDPCLNFSVTATPLGSIACFGGTANISVTAIGGLAPFNGTGTFAHATGSVSYTVTDASGCSATTVPFILNEPTQLTVLASSTQTNCSGIDGTATAVPAGGTPSYQYNWTPGGHTTAFISGLSPGPYTVKVTDANGCTTTSATTVGSAGTTLPAAPAIPAGITVVCKNDCITYTIPPVLNATSYQWTLTGKNVTGSSNTTSITVCFGSKFKGGNVCVRAVNSCGPGPVTCIAILEAKKPEKPSEITGEAIVCSSSSNQKTYCVPLDPQSSSYTWVIKGNANPSLTIASGNGSNCVVINVPAGYSGSQELSVKGVNCKDVSDEKKINIKSSSSVPAQPSSISGPSYICKSEKGKGYSVGSINNASTYNWTITGGALITSGQGDKSIKVDFRTATSTTVTLSVTASNGCGTSIPRIKTITVNLNCRQGIDSEDSNGSNLFETFNAYPNPTAGNVTVSFNSDYKAKGIIKLVDLTGRELISKEFSIEEGLNSRELTLENIAKGLYLISVQAEGREGQWVRLVVE